MRPRWKTWSKLNGLEKQNPADAIERTPRAENRREGKPTNDNSIQIAFTSSRRRASEGRKFRPPGKAAKGEADKHNKLSNPVKRKRESKSNSRGQQTAEKTSSSREKHRSRAAISVDQSSHQISSMKFRIKDSGSQSSMKWFARVQDQRFKFNNSGSKSA